MIHTDAEVAGRWQQAARDLGLELVWVDSPEGRLPESAVEVMICAVNCFARIRERQADVFASVILLDLPAEVKPLYEAGACSVLREPQDQAGRTAVLEFWSRYHRA